MHSFGSPREATSSAAATKYLSCCNSIGVSYWGNKHKLFPYINRSVERRLGANSTQPEDLTGLGRSAQSTIKRKDSYVSPYRSAARRTFRLPRGGRDCR